jgi:hypothetical protein
VDHTPVASLLFSQVLKDMGPTTAANFTRRLFLRLVGLVSGNAWLLGIGHTGVESELQARGAPNVLVAEVMAYR